MTANEKLAREWMIKTFLPDSSEWVDVKAQSLTALLDTVAARERESSQAALENALTQLREVRQMYVTLDERARRQEREKCAGMLKALAWDDSGLCVDPDLDEIADELAAAAAEMRK